MQLKDKQAIVIDMHAHAYPDDLSAKAIAGMEKAFRITSKNSGRVSGLLESMDCSGIDISVLQGVAMKPEQVMTINSWLMSVQSQRIKCFAAMHPLFKDFGKELERVKRAGFWGVKFHPEFQDFSPDEKRMFPFYEKIGELGLAMLFHTGFELSHPGIIHATPLSIRKVHDNYPSVTLIAGHFGGFMMPEQVEKHLVGTNVLLDTACIFGHTDDSVIRKIIFAHGAEKILFGSDHPLFSQKENMGGIKRLGLSEKEEGGILGKNAQKLFNQ
jgi:uncharacterized protein